MAMPSFGMSSARTHVRYIPMETHRLLQRSVLLKAAGGQTAARLVRSAAEARLFDASIAATRRGSVKT
jgi:hypothetical protein